MENHKALKHSILLVRILVVMTIIPWCSTFSQNKVSVGTPKAAFNVSNSGSAIYQVSIDIPFGGHLTPQIGITYNSQSNCGLVGYGCNITGISAITRGRKDLFHDGVQRGTSYSADDALYLNGTRLILQSGTIGYEGAVYAPEGDPYTKITVHGNCATSYAWFEVQTPDGLIYQYGKNLDARLSYKNRKGITHCVAWYLCYTKMSIRITSHTNTPLQTYASDQLP